MRGVRWYLVGSAVIGSLGVLAGCSGGRFFIGEREPWRHEAEAACLTSGALTASESRVRIKAISGPGVCGADFPIKVSALGDSMPAAYSDDLRPPSTIPSNSPTASMPRRWPGAAAPAPPAYESPTSYPASTVETRPLQAPPGADGPAWPTRADEPLSLDPRASRPRGGGEEPYDFRRPHNAPSPAVRAPMPSAPLATDSPAYDLSPEPYDRRRVIDDRRLRSDPALAGPRRPVRYENTPALGPARAAPTAAIAGPVSVTPAATLACPLVSVLDQWIAGAVQPAALRWFGQPVVEIKQISAYSCRGMNGNPNAPVSEHAFGNALDIAAFALSDGRKITVREGWRGRPEEQGFLRDVQGAACSQFNTVLAPGSNAYHYDHIHVDLMRRSDGRRACNPHGISGEEAAARARTRYAGRGDVTGSARGATTTRRLPPTAFAADDSNPDLPVAVPGADGED